MAHAGEVNHQRWFVTRRREVRFESLYPSGDAPGAHGCRRAAASAARSNSATRSSMPFSSTPFESAIKHALGRPEPNSRRYVRIGHKLEHHRASSTRSLLQPRHRLSHNFPASRAILLHESRDFKPIEQCIGVEIDGTCSVFYTPMRQEGTRFEPAANCGFRSEG